MSMAVFLWASCWDSSSSSSFPHNYLTFTQDHTCSTCNITLIWFHVSEIQSLNYGLYISWSRVTEVHLAHRLFEWCLLNRCKSAHHQKAITWLMAYFIIFKMIIVLEMHNYHIGTGMVLTWIILQTAPLLLITAQAKIAKYSNMLQNYAD